MKKEWLVKTLALGIVVLFIGTSVVSAFNVNLTDKSNTTMDNHPPDAPTIAGPTKLIVGKEYKFKFCSEDPDGDDVSYYVEWGDDTSTGWTNYFESGIPIILIHAWKKIDYYSFRVKAKDTYNATSDWSTIYVHVPRNKQIFNLPFIHFLEQFQNVFQILRFTKLI